MAKCSITGKRRIPAMNVSHAHNRTCFHAVDQSALAVRALVPAVHRVERGVALVDREHRTFDAPRDLRVGDHDRDLDDAITIRVEPRHLEVDPDKVVGIGRKRRAGRDVGVGHGGS